MNLRPSGYEARTPAKSAFAAMMLDAIDHGVSNFLLPAVGVGTALYVGWRLERSFALTEADFGDGGTGRIWLWLVRVLVSIAIAGILLQSAGAL